MNGERKGVVGFVIEILRRIAGASFSTAESIFISLACIGAGVGFAFYAELAGWRWSALQQIAAGFLVFDLVGGAIAYNSIYFANEFFFTYSTDLKHCHTE